MISTFDKIPMTAKELIKISAENLLSVHETLNRVRELEREARDKVIIPPYKLKPKSEDFYKKSNSPTLKEIREYADAVEGYEKYEKKRKAAMKKQGNVVPRTGDVLEGFIREMSGLNTIPGKYRDKVYRYAWEQGHSSGYSEVFHYLQELVEIFE